MENENRNEEKVELIDFKKEAAKRKLKGYVEAAKLNVIKGVKWVTEHPAEAAASVTGLGLFVKSVTKTSANHAEQRRREREFFEHSSGKWCEIKRKLTPREQVEAEARHKAGETWTQIFSDMRLLK